MNAIKKIHDCMKHQVISIRSSARIGEAVMLMTKNRIGTLPVVDDAGILQGSVQLRDLLALVMPDFVLLVEDFDFVGDFGAVESRKPPPEALVRKVTEVMQPPVSVEETSGLLRAFAVLHQEGLLDLAVVDHAGRLVGIASRVDIGISLLRGWYQPT
jgi:CBS-domain-containing membrane protein